eukprot:748079-Hanusia_phi.AAC.4
MCASKIWDDFFEAHNTMTLKSQESLHKVQADKPATSPTSSGRKRKLDGRQIQFSHSCSIRKYQYHRYRDGDAAEEPSENEALPMNRARLDYSEQTRFKDGPKTSCLLVKKLIESLVARKITDRRSFLECLLKTILACKGTASDKEGSTGAGEVDYSQVELDILLLTSKALLSEELLAEVDQRMTRMIAKIERQGVIGVLPGCVHLDKTFIQPLRFLLLQLNQTKDLIHPKKPQVVEHMDEAGRVQVIRNCLAVQITRNTASSTSSPVPGVILRISA